MASNNRFVILLLFTVFLKEVVFSLITPIWHGPDEQAHFAQIAYLAENGKMASGGDNDLNNEILMSERMLGTERDDRGNNKFTFNPSFRIAYTNTHIGEYEGEISNIPNNERRNYVRQEAARYPPLYYRISSAFYNSFYHSDLISRVYATRFFSILCGVGLALLGFLISREIFEKNKLAQYTSTIFVAFHPMLSFVSATVNSDNLFNLLFAIFIYLNILVVKKGLRIKIILLIILNFGLMALTKPQFVLGLPIFLTGVFLSLFYYYNLRLVQIYKLTFIIAVSAIGGVWAANATNIVEIFQSISYPQSFGTGFIPAGRSLSFYGFFKQTLLHTYSEVVPWYWGVFNWLGVTLPRDVHRLINRLLVAGTLGLLIEIILLVRSKSKKQLILILYLILCATTYFMGITIFNYLFTLSHGFPFGIQGRYYFPVVTAHMLLLYIGLVSLVPNKWGLIRQSWSKLLGILMITLNLVALWTIAVSYYDTSSNSIFIAQLSQYKPYFLKGSYAVSIVTIYFISLTALIIYFLKLKIHLDDDQ